jgi:transposase
MLWQRGKAYSQDLRERVFATADEGKAVGQIAALMLVSISYVSKVLSRRRTTGETRARAQRCHVRPKLAGLHDALRERVAAQSDATLAELQQWLNETHQVSASSGLISQTLKQLGLTLKKSPSGPPNRTVPMSRKRAPSGASSSQTSIRAS